MRKETLQAHLIKIAFLPFVYGLVMTIMGFIVFYNPSNFRLSNTSPATLCWFSVMLLMDSIHLILCLALYRGRLESQSWIVGGVPMVCISILKTILYFTSFICLLINPVADPIGAVTALISALALTAFLITRFFYLKNFNLNEKV